MARYLTQNRKRRTQKKRDRSSNVQTRNYRSSEVTLADYNYDQASDIWSLGVIFAELLNSISENKIKGRQLFRGNSCYPISPMESKTCER